VFEPHHAAQVNIRASDGGRSAHLWSSVSWTISTSRGRRARVSSEEEATEPKSLRDYASTIRLQTDSV